MVDIFISFATVDTPRAQVVLDAFRARHLTVFWSNDIPKGAPNYQSVIIEQMRNAPIVVVLWTLASVESQPVAQECSQAKLDNKLLQVVLDDIEPIQFPMVAGYMAQKTILIGWSGEPQNPEWIKLNDAIDVRLGRNQEPLKAVQTLLRTVRDGYFKMILDDGKQNPSSTEVFQANRVRITEALRKVLAVYENQILPLPLINNETNPLWAHVVDMTSNPGRYGSHDYCGVKGHVPAGRKASKI